MEAKIGKKKEKKKLKIQIERGPHLQRSLSLRTTNGKAIKLVYNSMELEHDSSKYSPTGIVWLDGWKLLPALQNHTLCRGWSETQNEKVRIQFAVTE